jgi:hypothetical protein
LTLRVNLPYTMNTKAYISGTVGKKNADSIVWSGDFPRRWQMAQVSKLAVIVAQYGADVSACVASHAEGPYEILQQAERETPGQLATRVRERLSHLVELGCRIDSASFVARTGFEVRDVMSVAGLLRGLVAAMVAMGAGQVHLHAEPSDLQTGYALTALADAISEQLHGTGVALATEFVVPPASHSTARPRLGPSAAR